MSPPALVRDYLEPAQPAFNGDRNPLPQLAVHLAEEDSLARCEEPRGLSPFSPDFLKRSSYPQSRTGNQSTSDSRNPSGMVQA